MSSDIQKIFDFSTYVEAFKKVERFVGQYLWKDYPFPKRYESNADHSWRMAMMLIVLEKKLSRPIDFKKAITMALIHDIPEIIAGDPSPLGTDGTGSDSHAYNKKVAKAKFERERKAAQEIFAKLPSEQGKELMNLWLEFEEQSSFESKIVKALDKMEGKLQVLEYTNGTMFKAHLDFTMTYGTDTFDADPGVKELGDILLSTIKEKYKEFKK